MSRASAIIFHALSAYFSTWTYASKQMLGFDFDKAWMRIVDKAWIKILLDRDKSKAIAKMNMCMYIYIHPPIKTG